MRKLGVAAMLVSIALALALPVTAVATPDKAAKIKLSSPLPVTVTFTTPVYGKLDLHRRGTFSLFCFDVEFEGDLFDPDEGMFFDFGDAGGGFGVINTVTSGQGPLRSISACTPSVLTFAALADGKARFAIRSEYDFATFTISQLTASFTP